MRIYLNVYIENLFLLSWSRQEGILRGGGLKQGFVDGVKWNEMMELNKQSFVFEYRWFVCGRIQGQFWQGYRFWKSGVELVVFFKDIVNFCSFYYFKEVWIVCLIDNIDNKNKEIKV